MCGNFYARPTLFERLRTQTALLFANTKVAMLCFSLGLGILAHKGAKAQGQPIMAENTVVENPTGFVTISVELRKENKENLLKEEFSVEILMDGYTAKLDKVTEGIAYFDIPAELLNTEATIIIKGNASYFIYRQKHTITADGIKAELDRKTKRELREEKKRRKNRQLRGCISF
jgi:hypothetical protein